MTSTVRDLSYQRLLARDNLYATRAYSLHTTGFAFDVRRRYGSRAQAAAFQYMLDRLQSLNLIAWVREPGAIHITVSGEASTVDVQNVLQQRVMTRDVIDAIPAGTKSVVALGVLIPGMTTNSQDVGGTQYGSAAMAIHGSRLFEQALLYDGMYYNNGAGRGGSFVAVSVNDATVREISLESPPPLALFLGLHAVTDVSGDLQQQATAAVQENAGLHFDRE